MRPLLPPALSLSNGLTLCALLLSSCATPPTAKPASVAAPTASASHFDIPATDDGLPGAGPIRRYDWFKKLWRERRTKWAAEAEKDRGAIVFLGDSITQGWHDDLDGLFPGL